MQVTNTSRRMLTLPIAVSSLGKIAGTSSLLVFNLDYWAAVLILLNSGRATNGIPEPVLIQLLFLLMFMEKHRRVFLISVPVFLMWMEVLRIRSIFLLALPALISPN